MALEPAGATADEGAGAELRDMERRLWIGSILTLPIFILAMADLVPPLQRLRDTGGDVVIWVQFVLATPVVLYCGWPFLVRAYDSIRHRALNMFTLIAGGTGIAYL